MTRERKEVLYTSEQFARSIHRHGLPVTYEAAGSGRAVRIRKVTEIAELGRKLLGFTNAFGNGFVLID